MFTILTLNVFIGSPMPYIFNGEEAAAGAARANYPDIVIELADLSVVAVPYLARIKSGEVLFNPSLSGILEKPLHEIIYDSIKKHQEHLHITRVKEQDIIVILTSLELCLTLKDYLND